MPRDPDTMALALSGLTSRELAAFLQARRRLGDLFIIELLAMNLPNVRQASTPRAESLASLKADILAAIDAHDRRLEAADVALARTMAVCGVEAAEEGAS